MFGRRRSKYLITLVPPMKLNTRYHFILFIEQIQISCTDLEMEISFSSRSKKINGIMRIARVRLHINVYVVQILFYGVWRELTLIECDRSQQTIDRLCDIQLILKFMKENLQNGQINSIKKNVSIFLFFFFGKLNTH